MTGIQTQRDSLDDTHLELLEWGKWVRQYRVALYKNPGMYSKAGGSANITDDRALILDRAVARLAQRNWRQGRAVFGYYALNLTETALAERLHCKTTLAKTLRGSGLAWVDGYLQWTDELSDTGDELIGALFDSLDISTPIK